MSDWKAYWAGFFKTIVLILLICHSLPTGDALTPTQWSVDAEYLVSRNCSRNLRPNHGGPPVEVGVSMYVLDISSISEETMDFQLDLYFRQHWTDTCLLPIDKSISLSIDNDPLIWTPDTFFVNEKSSYLRQRSPSNECLQVDSSGLINYSKRVSMTASCRVNLRYFPMDQQQCQLDIESYGHTTEDIKYKWNFGQASVGVSNDILLPQFKILKHKLKYLETEKYSRLTVEFQFQRFLGHHLMHVFLPAALIVIMSFTSIWINYRHTPIRIALSALAFFTMVVFASNINATLPKVSYVTAIDIYILGCLVIICSSLIEIIISSYINIKIKRKISMLNKIIKKKRDEQLVENSVKKIEQNEYCGKSSYDMDDDDSANMMDVYSKVLFPIMFIKFNLIFWIYYCSF